MRSVKAVHRRGGGWVWIAYDHRKQVVACSVVIYEDQLEALKAAEEKYEVQLDYLSGRVR